MQSWKEENPNIHGIISQTNDDRKPRILEEARQKCTHKKGKVALKEK